AHALTSNIYPAIDHLEEAAKLDPDSFAAHYTLAQLNFKLRTPKPGYEAARRALKCVQTLEQRKMLAQLLKEERERERNGIARRHELAIMLPPHRYHQTASAVAIWKTVPRALAAAAAGMERRSRRLRLDRPCTGRMGQWFAAARERRPDRIASARRRDCGAR